MKRLGFLHEKICELENIYLADTRARKNKTRRQCIKKHDKNIDEENKLLSETLSNLTYKTSLYNTFKIYEPKERLIFKLPYYPDRIAHHAIMNIMEPIWKKIFIKGTYSCIKGRGIHKLAKDLKHDLKKDPENTKYCLKMDIRKFYPSIKHDILIDILKKKIKDKKLITLLEGIVKSAEGVPIGNYLSLFFANLYMAYFDHWIKEEVKCKYYYRYADDIVILSNDKNFLKSVLLSIKLYFCKVLDISLKPNYQIYPVDSRGIDFVGYVFFHTHILLRKSIKLNMFRLIRKYKRGKLNKYDLKKRIQSYFGWLKYCNSKHLLNSLYNEVGLKFSNWNGENNIISNFYDRCIYVVDIQLYSKQFRINFMYNSKPQYFKSKNKRLLTILFKRQLPTFLNIRRYERHYKNKNNK